MPAVAVEARPDHESIQGRAIIPKVVVQDKTAPAEQILSPLFDLAGNAGDWPRLPF